MATKTIKRAASTALIAGLFTGAAMAPAAAQQGGAKQAAPEVWVANYSENNSHAAWNFPFKEIALPPAPAPEVAPAPEAVAAPIVAAFSAVVDFTTSKQGFAYVYGANGPDAFDCSGLMQWAYAQAGVSIPRTSNEQWAAGTPVSLDALQPGDIVVMYGGGHVAMYIGNGMVVHALNEGTGVIIDAMSSYPVDGAVRF